MEVQIPLTETAASAKVSKRPNSTLHTNPFNVPEADDNASGTPSFA